MQHSHLLSREAMFGRIVMAMAGRAAERIVFGELGISEGAKNDIINATSWAAEYIRKQGFHNTIGFYSPDGDHKFIQETDKTDVEISEIVKKALEQAKDIIEPSLNSPSCLGKAEKLNRKPYRSCCPSMESGRKYLTCGERSYRSIPNLLIHSSREEGRYPPSYLVP